MELKSLFLGILFSVGIFGIKAGAGLMLVFYLAFVTLSQRGKASFSIMDVNPK